VQVPEELHCLLVMDRYLERVMSHLLLTLDFPVYDLIVSIHSPVQTQYQSRETGLKGYYGFLQSDIHVSYINNKSYSFTLDKGPLLSQEFCPGYVYSNCSLFFYCFGKLQR